MLLVAPKDTTDRAHTLRHEWEGNSYKSLEIFYSNNKLGKGNNDPIYTTNLWTVPWKCTSPGWEDAVNQQVSS